MRDKKLIESMFVFNLLRELPRLRKLVRKIPCKSFTPAWLIVSAVRCDLIQHPLPSEEITVLEKTVAARRHKES